VHDFHPPISTAGLYWVVPVPRGGLTWENDGRAVTIEMSDVPVIDQPPWPAHGAPTSPALMSFRMTFEATDKPATYEDKTRHFRVTGFLATCRMEARVKVPALKFTWRSPPIEQCPPAEFAIIGEEVNGKYYDEVGK
jgi:hypothetical protein